LETISERGCRDLILSFGQMAETAYSPCLVSRHASLRVKSKTRMRETVCGIYALPSRTEDVAVRCGSAHWIVIFSCSCQLYTLPHCHPPSQLTHLKFRGSESLGWPASGARCEVLAYPSDMLRLPMVTGVPALRVLRCLVQHTELNPHTLERH
jgi:hypothetical protein